MSKLYHIGFLPGSYDLFHIGHLNILRNSKKMCECLIVGVLTDELVKYFKGKAPYIPFAERIAIVKDIKYVDEVIEINYGNVGKMDAWRQLHYDCHFAGSDHRSDFIAEKMQLEAVGAEMVFLPYTISTSSTQIKQLIEKSLL